MEGGRRLVERKIPIERMHCPTCVPFIEKVVGELGGVREARANYMTNTLKVTFDPEAIRLEEIEAAIEHLGYRIAYKRYPGIAERLKGLFRGGRGRVEALSDAEFPEKVLRSPAPTAVLISTPGCPPCLILRSTLEKMAEDLRGRAAVYEMDISATETWRRYDVLTVPTILIFSGGELKGRLSSLPPREDLERALGVHGAGGGKR